MGWGVRVLPVIPLASPTGDGDILGAEMPMGMGRAVQVEMRVVGEAKASRIQPRSPSPCCEVPARGWGTLWSSPLPALDPDFGVAVPHRMCAQAWG